MTSPEREERSRSPSRNSRHRSNRSPTPSPQREEEQKFLNSSTRGADPSKQLAVFNLNTQTTEKNLEERFKEFGEIESVALILDKQNNPKGFGFIHFKNLDDAIQAKEKMDRVTFLENELRVDFALPDSQRTNLNHRGPYLHPRYPSRFERERSSHHHHHPHHHHHHPPRRDDRRWSTSSAPPPPPREPHHYQSRGYPEPYHYRSSYTSGRSHPPPSYHHYPSSHYNDRPRWEDHRPRDYERRYEERFPKHEEHPRRRYPEERDRTRFYHDEHNPRGDYRSYY